MIIVIEKQTLRGSSAKDLDPVHGGVVAVAQPRLHLDRHAEDALPGGTELKKQHVTNIDTRNSLTQKNSSIVFDSTVEY